MYNLPLVFLATSLLKFQSNSLLVADTNVVVTSAANPVPFNVSLTKTLATVDPPFVC
jgi:uncharacterized membrane protein